VASAADIAPFECAARFALAPGPPFSSTILILPPSLASRFHVKSAARSAAVFAVSAVLAHHSHPYTLKLHVNSTAVTPAVGLHTQISSCSPGIAEMLRRTSTSTIVLYWVKGACISRQITAEPENSTFLRSYRRARSWSQIPRRTLFAAYSSHQRFDDCGAIRKSLAIRFVDAQAMIAESSPIHYLLPRLHPLRVIMVACASR